MIPEYVAEVGLQVDARFVDIETEIVEIQTLLEEIDGGAP